MLILVSTVLGAISGVGIWVTIGLVQPAATSMLIHTFVWGWAIEWAFFLLEVVTALAYYATWDKVSKETHLVLIWLYAFAAFMSLVVIQGILAFMLTPGRWLVTHGFADGFFNPTTLPGLVFRSGICLLLAGSYLAFAALREKAPGTRARLVRLLAGLGATGAVVAYAGYRLWERALPGDVRDLFLGAKPILASLAATRHLILWGLAAALLLALVSLALPRLASVGLAVLALLAAFVSFGGYERLREGARKPFIVSGYMFSNGILVSNVPELNRKGILSKAVWAAHDAGPTPLSKGRAVFRAECASCHTLGGYLSIRKAAAAMDLDLTRTFLSKRRKDGEAPSGTGTQGYRMMPPFVGNDEELDALAHYLVSLKNPEEVSRAR